MIFDFLSYKVKTFFFSYDIVDLLFFQPVSSYTF